MKETIIAHIQESIAVKQKLLEHHVEEILTASELWIQTIRDGGKILFCGNGGSASDAQHISTELMVRLKHSNNRPAIPALSLSTDTSLLTACGNDYGFNEIFSRQVEGLAGPNDLLVGISTSGNSTNVMRAIETAERIGTPCMALLGGDGGKIASMVQYPLIVPHTDTARIQEAHIMIGHILCDLTESKLYL